MEKHPFEVKYLEVDGKVLYKEWHRRLKDETAKDRIRTAVDRMEDGNFGDHHDLPNTGGLWELRIHYGKGYRVYYGYHKGAIIVVVCGGEKDKQDSDTMKATRLWAAFKGGLK
jgi:putative addiction module killer protein